MSKKLETLLEKRERLNAQIVKQRNKESQLKRKRDTRRKILLGALVMNLMDSGELSREKMMEELDVYLTKDIDRALFDLPPRNEKKKKE